jgi:hypothetical protein
MDVAAGRGFLARNALLRAGFLRSVREHLAQHRERPLDCRGGKSPQSLHQARAIHGSKLVKDDVTGLSLELARHAERVRMDTGRQRRHDAGLHVRIQLIR